MFVRAMCDSARLTSFGSGFTWRELLLLMVKASDEVVLVAEDGEQVLFSLGSGLVGSMFASLLYL